MERGGGGAIDLIMHLYTLKFKAYHGPERDGYMRLVMATSDFLVAGRSFAGFPCCSMMTAGPWNRHTFLWQALIPMAVSKASSRGKLGAAPVRLLCFPCCE
jgi:hypothetical protein